MPLGRPQPAFVVSFDDAAASIATPAGREAATDHREVAEPDAGVGPCGPTEPRGRNGTRPPAT